MPLPVLGARENPFLVIRELVDDGLRQLTVFHVVERRVVDHIECRATAQPRQKRLTRFTRAGAKYREAIGPDLRGVAALSGVARAGIVDRDIGPVEAGVQHRFVFGAEGLELDRQQADDLPLRNHHAHSIEKRDDPIAGDLSGEMQRQDEAMQIGAVSPDNPGIEGGGDRLALRRLPTLPPIARHLRTQAQVLNHDLLVAPCGVSPGGAFTPTTTVAPIVSLSSWLPRRRLDFFPSRLLAPPPSETLRSVALSMPEGFCGGRGGKFFNRASSSLTARCSAFSSVKAPLSFSFSARSRPTSPINSRTTPIRSVCVRRSSESGGRAAIPSLNHIFALLTPPLPGNVPRLPRRLLTVGRLEMNRKILVASVVLAVAITAIGDTAHARAKKSRAYQYGTSQ